VRSSANATGVRYYCRDTTPAGGPPPTVRPEAMSPRGHAKMWKTAVPQRKTPVRPECEIRVIPRGGGGHFAGTGPNVWARGPMTAD